MHVRTATDDAHGIVLVTLSGPVTDNTARTVRRVLGAAAATHARVIVDLRRLRDVDPALALVLLEHDDRLAQAGGRLCLIHGPGRAGSSLRFMGLHDRIRSSPSLVASGWDARSTKRSPGQARVATGPVARR
jgi:anti-anti-sigma regulatory factor